MNCWYCGEIVSEIWQIKDGHETHYMPMCSMCAAFVRVSNWLRDNDGTSGHVWAKMADELDNKYGIDTRRGEGYSEWISPNKGLQSSPKNRTD